MPAVSEGLIRFDRFSHLFAFVCSHYSVSNLILDTLFLPKAFGPATLEFRLVVLNPLCTLELPGFLLKKQIPGPHPQRF